MYSPFTPLSLRHTGTVSMWFRLKRHQKAQHITRWLLGALLVISGAALQGADVTRATPRVIEMDLPVIDFATFADYTLFCGLLCFFVRKPSLLQWAMLCTPFFLYTFYTVQGVFQGVIQPSSLAGVAYFIILCFLLLVTFYGYSED